MTEKRAVVLCESCLVADINTPATTHSTNPEWSSLDLCDECAREYDARPAMVIAGYVPRPGNHLAYLVLAQASLRCSALLAWADKDYERHARIVRAEDRLAAKVRRLYGPYRQD